jgi:hypothetical protein
VTLLKIEIDDAAYNEASALPVFHGSGGLQSGIDPRSNKSMLDAADDQQGDDTKRLRGQATADLMLAIEGATLAAQAHLLSQKATHQQTLREELYTDDFRAEDRNETSLRKYPGKQKKP